MYSVLFATAIALSSVLTPFVTASPVLSTRGLDYNWNDLRPNSMLMFQDMSCEDIKNMGAPALMHNTDVSVIEQEPQMKKAITELLIWHETNSHGKWTYVGLDLDDKPLTFDFLYYQNYKIKTILFTFNELKYNFKAYRKNDNAEYWLVDSGLGPMSNAGVSDILLPADDGKTYDRKMWCKDVDQDFYFNRFELISKGDGSTDSGKKETLYSAPIMKKRFSLFNLFNL